MSQPQLLKHVVTVLGQVGVDYMLTGSLVSSLQGEPRATHDIDIVVALPSSAVSRLRAAFPEPDFYVDEQAVRDAVDQHGMFNVIDTREGDKVDFWLLTNDPFDRSRFQRRHEEDLLGTRVYVSSPEDTILVKLHWAKQSGGSEKQFGDALRVYELQFARIDQDYLSNWADQMDIVPLWRRLRDEAMPL